MVTAQGPEKPATVFLSREVKRSIPSPNGKWALGVRAESGETPWLVLQAVGAEPRYTVQVWPINNSVYVLWEPDSQAFAFTDARFEDDYHLFVDHLSGYLESQVVDLTSLLESRSSRLVDKRCEILRWHAKPLTWVRNGLLLVGVDCDTAEKTKRSPSYVPVQGWLRSYIVDVQREKVTADLDEKTTRRRFGVDLRQEKW
jgi:hypothetical protein